MIASIAAGAIAVYLIVAFGLIATKMILPKLVDHLRDNDPHWSDEDEAAAKKTQDDPYWPLVIWPISLIRGLTRNR